jgi:autotransporter-associated beta strand protein
MKNMNRTPIHPQHAPGSRRSKTYSAALATLAAAMLALSTSDLQAASGTWQANPADQAASITITSNSKWTTSSPLVEGDAVVLGFTGGLNLGTTFSYYYVVGVGSTPSSDVRFSQSPGSGTFNVLGGADLVVTKVPTWFTAGNWSGGIVPNGIDDSATIVTSSTMNTVMLDRDLTIGSLSVDTSTCGSHSTDSVGVPQPGANGLSLIATSRTSGLMSTLTLQRSIGTPTITLTGGNSLSFSDSKLNANSGSGNASGKLVIRGNQGLVINNTNTVPLPVAVNSRTSEATPSSVPTYGVGPVRFGFGLDWSGFSGDLTLAQGVFQTLAGGTLNNNLTSLPMNSKVVLGTSTNTARLEITGANGQSVIRGLESSPTASSSIINTAAVTGASISLSTLELGSYGLASDSFDYAGNIGDSTNIATLASSSSIRLVKAGPGTQILSGRNDMNATASNSVLVAVNGGKLSLGTTGAIGTITSGQGAASAASSIQMKNGEFAISGLGKTDGPRSQAFGGFLIFGTVAPNTSAPDVNQMSQSNSYSTLTVTADSTQPATLTFGAIKPRNFQSNAFSNMNGATMLYRGTNLGATPGLPGVATISITTAPTAGGGNLSTGTLGTTTAPVLKGALADTSPTGTGTGFATYDPVTGVRLLTSSEKNVVASGPAYDAAPTTDNIVFNLTADAPITGHSSSTLQIGNASGASRTITNTGTALNAANGMLFSGTDPIVLTGGAITGTVDTDAEDVVFHSINTSSAGVTIQMPVSNFATSTLTRQGWVTFSGTGNFRIAGTQTVGFVGANTSLSSFGGIAFNSKGTTTIAAPIINATTLAVNQGIVKLDTGATWTNTPRLLLAPEGKFDLNGIGSVGSTNRFTDINSATLISGLTLNPISGEVTNSSGTTADLVLSTATNGAVSTAFFGTVTGNLNLIVDKSSYNSGTTTYTYGVQAFANKNTYTGRTDIRSGILNLARGGLLPTTTVVTLGPPTDTGATSYANSTLQLGDANGATSGAVRQEIAGLFATGIGVGLGTATNGNGTAAVINSNGMVSQLTLNIPSGPADVYVGNLGVTPTTNGSNSNLFGLRKIGPGTFEPNGAVNAYSGGTIIQGGIFRISADAKLGQIGPLTGAAGSAAAALAPMSAFPNSIILDGGALQTTTTFALDPNRGIGMGPTSGSTGGTGTLSVDVATMLTYNGVIASAGNTGTQTLVKNGLGFLALNGTSTFTGVTSVAAGSLGGTGTLASGVSVGSGGSLAPGSSVGLVGTFHIGGALTLTTGAALTMDLDAPGTSDLIQVGGAVSATGSTTINVNPLAGFTDGVYTLISGTAPISTANLHVGTLPVGHKGTLASVGNTLTLTIAPGSALTPIESWRMDNFGDSANTGNGADTADFDGDGISNLVEYATGSNPVVSGPGAFSTVLAGNFLALTYTRIADTTLTYTVEASSDLAIWTTVSTGNNPSTGAQNVAGQVTVTDPTSAVDAPGRRFLRLKVSY